MRFIVKLTNQDSLQFRRFRGTVQIWIRRPLILLYSSKHFLGKGGRVWRVESAKNRLVYLGLNERACHAGR